MGFFFYCIFFWCGAKMWKIQIYPYYSSNTSLIFFKKSKNENKFMKKWLLFLLKIELTSESYFSGVLHSAKAFHSILSMLWKHFESLDILSSNSIFKSKLYFYTFSSNSLSRIWDSFSGTTKLLFLD